MASPAFRLTLAMESVEALAKEIGVSIQTKEVARFPAEYRTMIESVIRSRGLTGSLTQHFSQGGVGYVTWESSR
jgi:hypothetical protein